MSCSILEFAWGEAGFGSGVNEVVEGMAVDFGNPRAEEGANEEFEALEFSLDDYQAKVGFWVCVPCLLFHEFNLINRLCISQCS